MQMMNEDYVKTIETVTGLEKSLNWEHVDTKQRERCKREWASVGRRDLLSIVPVYPVGDRIRFVFGRDFIPHNLLTAEIRRIGTYSFVTPSIAFMKEMLMSKVDNGKLLRERRKKIKD